MAVEFACEKKHSRKDRYLNWWVRGDDEILVRRTYADYPSRFYLYARCRWCGSTSTFIPKRDFEQWARDSPYPVENEHIESSSYRILEECSIDGCRSTDIEWHHFAPREVFRDEADQWPVLPLCVDHHREWHRKMVGYREPEMVLYRVLQEGEGE